MTAPTRVDMIRRQLHTALAPQHLEISDDSHKHAGHAGARAGGGHFSIVLVADIFAGQSPLQRHRLVYKALAEGLKGEIHALSIRAFTPEEFAAPFP